MITLEDIQAKIPDELKDQLASLAPVLGKLAKEELAAIIEKLQAGNLSSAYLDILSHLSGQQIVDQWDAINDKWQAANDAQAERVERIRFLATSIKEFLLRCVIAGVFL